MKGKLISSLAVAAIGFVLAAMPAVAYDVFPGSVDPDGIDLNVDFLNNQPAPGVPANCDLACLGITAGIDTTGLSSVNSLYTITVTDSTFTISLNGATFADCGTCYLYVKDGNLAPYAYLFDISTWDGQETIDGFGFWAGAQGGISHVDIYAGGTGVPEPASLLLLGAGLVGIAIWRRNALKI